MSHPLILTPVAAWTDLAAAAPLARGGRSSAQAAAAAVAGAAPETARVAAAPGPSTIDWRMADPAPPRVETTRLLRAMGDGEAAAAERLLPLVYDELHRMADRLMRQERADHTLQATALLNEAFLRLVDARDGYADRAHFLRVAARAMRHVLVDHARARAAQKRGGAQARVDLDESAVLAADQAASLLAVDEILARLAALDPQLGEIVELRYFGGMKDAEVAEALGTSLRSVQRAWRTARAWLQRELGIEQRRDEDQE